MRVSHAPRPTKYGPPERNATLGDGAPSSCGARSSSTTVKLEIDEILGCPPRFVIIVSAHFESSARVISPLAATPKSPPSPPSGTATAIDRKRVSGLNPQ